jgi:hypothetical protein
MAIEIEKHELRSFEIRKRKHKQRVIILTLMLLFIVLGVAAFVVNQILHKDYTTYQVIHSTEREDSNSARYQSYGTGVFRYSKDGAMAMDGAGTLLWNGTYEMKDPIVDICNKFVVVSDRGYESIQIFDGEGGMATINVLNPIIKVVVAEQGVVAVLMEGIEANYIELYSLEGQLLVDSRTTTEKDGCPIDIALSNDGKKLVTSYIYINNGAVQNKLTFYNFGGVGQNYVSRVAGGFDYGQTLIPDVEFLTNNTVCAFGDDKFSLYSMTEQPELLYEETFTEEIKSTFHNDKYVGFVLNNADGEDKYRVLVYDLKGEKVTDKMMNYDYDTIVLSGEELILYSNLEWIILKINGVEKFHYTFETDISYIFPVNNYDKYILIDTINMSEVLLTEAKDTQE